MRTARILGGAAAVLIAAGVVVAAQPGGSGGRADVAHVAVQNKDLVESNAAGSATADAFAAPASAAPTTPSRAVPAAQARVVKTASLSVSVANGAVNRVADRAASIATGAGGFVASTERQSGGDKSATLTVRVPVDTFDQALRGLRKLGKVTDETLGGHDVTGTLVDLDARLRSLRAQEQSLNALLAKANTVGETLQVAQASGEVRTQIEQLAAQQQQLADQADFATITLTVLGPHASVDPTPRPEPLLVSAVQRAGAGTLNVVGGVIVVLGYAIPAAVLGALGFGLWRLVDRRRRREVAPA